jgi:hypothetical protein
MNILHNYNVSTKLTIGGNFCKKCSQVLPKLSQKTTNISHTPRPLFSPCLLAFHTIDARSISSSVYVSTLAAFRWLLHPTFMLAFSSTVWGMCKHASTMQVTMATTLLWFHSSIPDSAEMQTPLMASSPEAIWFSTRRHGQEISLG